MITLDLPIPPSANRIWMSGSARTVLSDAYKDWKRAADQFALAQLGAGHREPISGPFCVTITLDRKRNGRGDPDNRIKPTLDYLQRAGVVANDKHLERLTLQYGEAPEGMRLTVEAAA